MRAPGAGAAAGPVRVARGARGAVVAPHHLATAAGLAALEAGGHAVDAAIAAHAVLAVVMPNGCGLGGDAFWLVRDEATGSRSALNGSGRAPAGLTPALVRAAGHERVPLRGPLSITIPGAVRSWADAHRRWGRLDRGAVLGAAIGLAEEGFAAWGGLVAAIEATRRAVGGAPWGDGFRRTWLPGGRVPRVGERLRLPVLAATLGTLARDGFDALYEGDLADRIARGLAAAGAPVTAADLREHRSTWAEPVERSYRGVRVMTHPPNGAGIVALLALGILERFEPPAPGRFGPRGWRDPRWIHLQLEAAKLALAVRDAHLADPASRPVPLAEFCDPERAAALAARIDPRRADSAPTPVRTLVGGTAYLAVVDAEGDAVSLIASNAAGFGSGVLDPETGIHYQDRGASFSLEPGHPNLLVPGRRTAHTLMPGMLFRPGDPRPWIVAGSMGGDIQPQLHAALVSALVDGGADLATAIGAPRVAVEPEGWFGPPTTVLADGSPAPGVLAGLAALGHRVGRAASDGELGQEHAIELVAGGPAVGGTLAAVTDPRSAGLPAAR